MLRYEDSITFCCDIDINIKTPELTEEEKLMDEGREWARQTKIQDSKRKEEKWQEKKESPIDSLRRSIFIIFFSSFLNIS